MLFVLLDEHLLIVDAYKCFISSSLAGQFPTYCSRSLITDASLFPKRSYLCFFVHNNSCFGTRPK